MDASNFKGLPFNCYADGSLNMIPFGLAAAFMIVWGVHADKSGNKSLNTAIPLFVTSFGLLLTILLHL